MASSDYFAKDDLPEFRRLVDEITDQLCEAVTGGFNFRVRSSVPDETLDKLAMLSNFVLEGARRSLRELAEKNRELEEARADLQKKVEDRTFQLSLETQKALAANKSKDQFLANMSHEMRTPLTAIMGFSDLIATGVDKDDSEEFLETIRRNASHLLSLIDDILDFSKIESGKVLIERAPVSLQDLLKSIESSFLPMVDKKGIEFRFDLSPQLPALVLTDATRIRQIVTNLVTNAIKFTDHGAVHASIGMVSNNGLPQLFVKVKDSGIGIRAEAQAKLFAPFSQADMSLTRKYGGTGLGLALSRKIARSMGGDLVIEQSEPNAGSTFSFWLPFEIIEQRNVPIEKNPSPRASQSTVSQTSQSTLSQQTCLQRMRVLLAEDSVDNQYLLKRVLENNGAQVLVAKNGIEAVDLALKNEIDVVLMDIQMPLLDGYQATRLLRSQSFMKPILALTAHAMDQELERALEAGCNDRLIKPIDTEKLVASILVSTEMVRS